MWGKDYRVMVSLNGILTFYQFPFGCFQTVLILPQTNAEVLNLHEVSRNSTFLIDGIWYGESCLCPLAGPHSVFIVHPFKVRGRSGKRMVRIEFDSLNQELLFLFAPPLGLVCGPISRLGELDGVASVVTIHGNRIIESQLVVMPCEFLNHHSSSPDVLCLHLRVDRLTDGDDQADFGEVS